MSDYNDYSEDGGQEFGSDPLDGLGYSPEETQAAREVLHNAIGQEIEQAVQPLQENLHYVTSELEHQDYLEDLADLEDKYPDLQKEAVADEVMVAAREFCEERGLRPEAATSPEVLEIAYLRSVHAGGGQQQPQRTSPGRQVGNALAFDADTPEAQGINDAILSRQGNRNVWGQSY